MIDKEIPSRTKSKNDCRMKFGFNEERINQDGEYTLEETWQMLEQCMKERHLHSASQGIYVGNYRHNIADYVNATVHLSGLDWFCKYCNYWVFDSDNEGNDNIYEHMKEHNLCK